MFGLGKKKASDYQSFNHASRKAGGGGNIAYKKSVSRTKRAMRRHRGVFKGRKHFGF